MAALNGRVTFNLHVDLVLTEVELRALRKVTEWGDEALITGLKANMNKSEVEENRIGLISFFGLIREKADGILARLEMAKKAFNGEVAGGS